MISLLLPIVPFFDVEFKISIGKFIVLDLGNSIGGSPWRPLPAHVYGSPLTDLDEIVEPATFAFPVNCRAV